MENSDTSLFENLIKYTPHAFVFADMEGNILMSNPAADKLYGYNHDELKGKNVDIFNSKQTIETDIIVKDIKEKGYWQGELVQKKKDGSTFHAELTVNLTFDGEVPIGLCSYSRDISDKKEAEIQLTKSQSLLTSSAKLSAIGEMASGIAHEINSPLSIIMNKTERVERHLDENQANHEKIIKDLKDIGETTKRISEIVSGLKAISRNSDDDPKVETAVTEIVDSTLKFCTERFKHHGVDLSVEYKDTEELILKCRPSQISQVLLNLLNNSFDAIESLSEKWILVEILTVGECLCVKVSDSGKKLDEELLEQIGQPFFTTKDIGKGTGLGMSISKRILNDHGGKLLYDLESENTCFCIQIPINGEEVCKKENYFQV